MPSCRAHAFMRVGTPTFVTRRKGGKGVPKGEENRSERFSEGNLLPFLPFGNPHLFRKSRNASARQARGVSRLRVRKGSSRDVEISISTAPSAREPPNDTVSVSHRRFSDGGEPRPVERWERFQRKGRKPLRTVVFPFFGTSLPTFVV